jgi:hypothetical protein
MMRKTPVLLLLAALAVPVHGSAAAQQPNPGAPGTSSNVQVLSGGIGLGERQALAERARAFNLRLVFALSTGNYVSDVSIDIRDARGRTVVQHVSDGPIAYATLPPGRYSVTARFGKSAQTKSVSIGSRGQKAIHFRWRGLGDTPLARSSPTPDTPRGS